MHLQLHVTTLTIVHTNFLSLVPDKIEKLDTSVEEEGGDEEEEEGDNIINRKKDLVKNYGKRMFRKVCCVFLLNWLVSRDGLRQRIIYILYIL